MTIDAHHYWQPVCDVVHRFRCWVRLASKTDISPWGQLLTMPVAGYLEVCWGPVPLREVAWVQIMPVIVRGGRAGRPIEFVDIRDDVVAALCETPAIWSLRDEVWSLRDIFHGRQSVAIHIVDPFQTDVHEVMP